MNELLSPDLEPKNKVWITMRSLSDPKERLLVAREIADQAACSRFAGPLRRFLDSSSQYEGLRGVLLSLTRVPDSLPILTTIGILDNGDEPSSQAARDLGQAFDHTISRESHGMGRLRNEIDADIGFLYVQGVEAEEMLARMQIELPQDPYFNANGMEHIISTTLALKGSQVNTPELSTTSQYSASANIDRRLWRDLSRQIASERSQGLPPFKGTIMHEPIE